jgi:uncharacterized protein (TIGR03084 family)
MQPTQVYDTILTALAEQEEELDGLVAGLDDDGWSLAAPRCPGWTISDVLLHVAQTDEAATASAERRPGGVAQVFGSPETRSPDVTADDLAGRAVAAQRGPSGKEVYERWRAASAAQGKALRACEPGDRLRWLVGELSAVTLATTRLAEGWIHTGDVAAGLGRELTPTARLQPIARLAWRTLPYAFAQAGLAQSGPVALSLTAPDGTTWEFTPAEPAATTVTGPALDFCLVAARRVDPSDTALSATGPDAAAVLDLVRTFA